MEVEDRFRGRQYLTHRDRRDALILHMNAGNVGGDELKPAARTAVLIAGVRSVVRRTM
jgi:hypothetical protein